MQAQRNAEPPLTEDYAARKYEVHVGGIRWLSKNPEGYEGFRTYKTERGARAFAEKAAAHYGKTVHILESWQRPGAWWVGGLRGQLRAEYRDGEWIIDTREAGA